MSGAQVVLALVLFAVQGALLLGLVRRRHYRTDPFFVLYAVLVTLSNAALSIWYVWEVWIVHQAVTAGTRFGVALGLVYSIFRNFPAAAATARRMLLLTLMVTLAAALSLLGVENAYADGGALLVARIANVTVWLFTALAALVLWYRLPLSRLQKAILLGYAPYLLVFTVAMNVLSSIGWHKRVWVGYVDTSCFGLLLLYWSVAAWRPVTVEEAPPVAVRVSVVLPAASAPSPERVLDASRPA